MNVSKTLRYLSAVGSAAVMAGAPTVALADGTPLFNARTETASVKPFFRDDWKRHRCIVPASHYYEWTHGNKKDTEREKEAVLHSNPLLRNAENKKEKAEKYAIQTAGATVTWLCGLYRIEADGFPYFVVLTREPSADLRMIHDRMPMILPEEKIDEWIRPEVDPSGLVGCAITVMVWEKVV